VAIVTSSAGRDAGSGQRLTAVDVQSLAGEEGVGEGEHDGLRDVGRGGYSDVDLLLLSWQRR
jgi:hypothetical protein